MGGKASIQGGGSATATGNDFNSWLQSMLNGSQYSPGVQQAATLPGSLGNQGDIASFFNNKGGANLGGAGQIPAAQLEQMRNQVGYTGPTGPTGQNGGTNLDYGMGQGGSSFQNAFNNMLNGQVNDQSGANAAIANSISGGPSTQFQDFTNPYSSQNYSGANVSQLPTNLLQGSGMADMSGIGQTAQSNLNFDPASSQYTNMLNALMGQGSSMVANQSPLNVSAQQANIGPGIALDPETQFDMNNPYFAALKQQQERGRQQALADNNARWGAQGAGAIGTGAALANNDIQTKMDADQTVALQQALEGLQRQDLAERGTRANVGLTSRGQDAQVGIANMEAALRAGLGNQSAGLQSNQQNNNLINSLISGALSGRGQDFQNIQNSQGNNLQQSLFNAGQTNDRNAQDISALLQNQGLGNNFQVSGAGLNSQNQQLNNSNQMDMAQQLNNFNLANAGNTANFGNQTNQLNSQNYQTNQNNWNNLLGMGQNTNVMGNQNIQQAINLMMQSLNGSANRGIPQAEVVQQGSNWGGIAGAALPFLGDAAKGIWNKFSGGNNSGGNNWNAPGNTSWQTPVSSGYSRPTIG